MSYVIMKQKQLPARFKADDKMSKLEIAETLILTLLAVGIGIGFIWFIVELTKMAITM